MRRRRVVIIVALFVVFLTAALVVRSLGGGPTNKCLDGDDYRDLTQQAMPASVDPSTNFYSYVLEFTDNTIIADNEEQVAAKIAQFYTDHKHKSIHITLSGVNQDPTSSLVATKRIESFVDKLKQGGVKAANITSSDPEFYELDSNYAGLLTATITTNRGCEP